jgi:hypothetical protein
LHNEAILTEKNRHLERECELNLLIFREGALQLQGKKRLRFRRSALLNTSREIKDYEDWLRE